jgi:hypothetical protein
MYFDMNPVRPKAALQFQGRIASGEIRIPLRDAKEGTVERLRDPLAHCSKLQG